MKRKMQEYEVVYHGRTKVKAHTYDEARSKVESSKDIKNIGTLETKSNWYLVAKGFMQNAGAMVTMVIAIGLMQSWVFLMDKVQTLPDELVFIGLLGAIMVILLSLRIPRFIGRKIDLDNLI